MNCPFCGFNKVIVCHAAPIGGVFVDPVTNVETPRIRCARCNHPIVMSEVQPSSLPRRPRRGKVDEYGNQEY